MHVAGRWRRPPDFQLSGGARIVLFEHFGERRQEQGRAGDLLHIDPFAAIAAEPVAVRVRLRLLEQRITCRGLCHGAKAGA